MAARLSADFPDYEPVVRMAFWANDLDAQCVESRAAGNMDTELRLEVIKAHSMVADYVTPKLKAVEHSGPEGEALTVILTRADAEL